MTRDKLSFRVGQGFDVHAFGAGDHVVLCGVEIPHSAGLRAHSDGDVGIHALCDALLGAAGLGDIGHHFPPSDPRWKGADSRKLLRLVSGLLKAQGWEVNNVDVTLICETPRLAPHIAGMRARLADDLGIPGEAVSVKATTTEGLGFCGRGEGIAAMAIASIGDA
ncbi:MAG: 2-C-methyl-D-erythritol 2,4-cyclodiphosphate synthase [Xanthomonadales bacterium]|nr:2-C-methyl-D-erythritol 2,4-cyclodiphosphate synthase [Xanthomonadales bacterium]